MFGLESVCDFGDDDCGGDCGRISEKDVIHGTVCTPETTRPFALGLTCLGRGQVALGEQCFSDEGPAAAVTDRGVMGEGGWLLLLGDLMLRCHISLGWSVEKRRVPLISCAWVYNERSELLQHRVVA